MFPRKDAADAATEIHVAQQSADAGAFFEFFESFKTPCSPLFEVPAPALRIATAQRLQSPPIMAVSLIGVVSFGTVTGSMLPFVLQRLRFDPAAASVPLVATLVDVMGLIIYFGVAIIFLRGTLL